MVVRSTHSIVLMLMRFESINVFKANEGLDFDMESAGLTCPWIYFILVISRCLYNWQRLITSTISRLSFVIPNLTRQLYEDLESVHKISRTADPSIFPSVAFMTTPISNPYAIPYSSAAKTLRVTWLHLIED